MQFIILLGTLVSADTVPTTAPDSVRLEVVSARVGPEIDASERSRFHLFPGIIDFESAQFLLMPDSSHWVEVRTAAEPAGWRRPLESEQFRRIGRFIDRYEELAPELAAMSGGQALYFDLWTGVGGPGATPDSIPDPAAAAARSCGVVDGLSAAACGLGLGSIAGAIAGTKFVETRQESLVVHGCLSGEPYWYHFLVDIYELNQGTYAAYAGTGLAVGSGAGWLAGQVRDRHVRRAVASQEGIVAFDFFGEPISEAEVRSRLRTSDRVVWTSVGATAGWTLGTCAGLVLTALARSIIFRPTQWDSIIVRGDGFSLDLPLIALGISGALQGGRWGYAKGARADWRRTLDLVRRERLRLH